MDYHGWGWEGSTSLTSQKIMLIEGPTALSDRRGFLSISWGFDGLMDLHRWGHGYHAFMANSFLVYAKGYPYDCDTGAFGSSL